VKGGYAKNGELWSFREIDPKSWLLSFVSDHALDSYRCR
jgi:hypothetical protein